jgi:KDO2-lipid IV(A) lauroyltransferase
MDPVRRIVARWTTRVRRLRRKAKNGLMTSLANAALWYIDRQSLEDALLLGERFGDLAFLLLRRPRRLALEHLRMAFGDEISSAGCSHIARASLVNMARSFCELAKIDEIRLRAGEYIESEGEAHVDRSLEQGGGAIIVTGHIGNWELLAAYWAWQGYSIAAIARRIYIDGLNQMLVEFRRRQGVETILRESPHSSRQLLRAIKNNSLLAMLIDQDTQVQSVSVPFFGQLARTPAAAASLAIRRDLPVHAAFIQRRPQGGHRITITPAFEIERSGDLRTDITALTRAFNAALEAQVRRNPAEWVWWHRRWRRRPQPQLDLDQDVEYTP